MVAYNGTYGIPRLDLGEAMLEYQFDAATFIGTKLWPIWPSPRKEANFPRIRREGQLRPGTVKRAPKSAYNRDSFEAEDITFRCEERGHEALLDDSERALYINDFDAELQSAAHAMWRVMYDQENDIKDAVINTTTFTVANGLRTDVSTAWSTITADIVGDILTAKEVIRARTGMDPDTLWFGASVLPDILKNTAIRGEISPTQLPSVEAIQRALAALFGLPKILIGGGVSNTADEDLDATLADIWTAGFAGVCKTAAEGMSLQTPVFGRTMLWVEDSPEAVMVEEYPENQTRSQVFRSRSHADELLIDANQAQLLDIAG